MAGNRHVSGFTIDITVLASFGDLDGTSRKDSGRLIRLARRKIAQLSICGISIDKWACNTWRFNHGERFFGELLCIETVSSTLATVSSRLDDSKRIVMCCKEGTLDCLIYTYPTPNT